MDGIANQWIRVGVSLSMTLAFPLPGIAVLTWSFRTGLRLKTQLDALENEPESDRFRAFG